LSTIRARFLKNKVTRWRESTYNSGDVYSKSWAVPVSFRCAYKSGGDIQRDNEGGQFQPASTYYLKLCDIKVGDKVALGISSVANPTDSAETVKKIVTKTTLVGSADMTIYTG
jgi:hypothetical protein